MKAWAARQEPDVIPFTPMTKPLAECTVALVSTAGIARNDDVPFDQERERRDPWWGDPSFRVIPLGTTERDVRLYHMRIDPRFGEADLDVVLPMRRLTELAQARVVGRAAPGTIRSWATSSSRQSWSRRQRRPSPSRCATMVWTRPHSSLRDRFVAGPWDWFSA